MDPDKLKSLQIPPEAKRRSSSFVWIIVAGVIVLSAIAVFLAVPRKADEARVLGGKNSNKNATNSSAASTTSSTNDSVLTVSGYIVNRERIELSPRFMGVVKWIGVKKGDTVTNGQVLVLLDDAEQKARLLEAEGRLANTKVAVNKADLDYERVKKLIA